MKSRFEREDRRSKALFCLWQKGKPGVETKVLEQVAQQSRSNKASRAPQEREVQKGGRKTLKSVPYGRAKRRAKYETNRT